ncbi:GATA transcription factor LreA [Purpureocillium lavendulum]|uniref:GATA transcription factor LreA n=1 Tax=Purpureocillium lavendulum TaxID=1247861 RepID=A0AB34FL79_9HYPO|nr:GATA transcription factor LreA [Purpureocillium lavendulum]
MDGYYSHSQLPPQELQRQLSQQQDQQHQHQQHLQGGGMNMPMQHHMQQQPGMSQVMQEPSILSGDSLDDMMRNNQEGVQRRRSMPQTYGNPGQQTQSQRRMSAMGASDLVDFVAGDADLSSYQFSQSMGPPAGLSNINTNLGMGDQIGNFMHDPTDYSTISPDLMGSMIPASFANMDMGQMANDGSMNLLSAPGNAHASMSGAFSPSQMAQLGNDFSMSVNAADMGSLPATTGSTSGAPGGMGEGGDDMMGMQQQQQQQQQQEQQQQQQFGSMSSMSNPPPANAMNLDPNSAGLTQSMPPPLLRHVSSGSGISPQRVNSTTSVTQQSGTSDTNTPATVSTPRESKEKTIYSKSGFDMLKALWLVATRKDPKIHLGAVDMSCAFVVCDVTMNDCPIVYVSDNFQNLTGYSRHEIVGQNCRFLQAPDGKVEAGSKREFVDDGAVYNLKKMIHEGREVQQSLINYRKGGKPFLNLLTMIPIPWDTDDIRYFIGFQIDLVECPDAISGQELGGVKVDYKHSDIGQYIWTPPASSQWEPESGQTLGVDDVSTLLQQFTPKGLVSDWHKQSWDKMLLENTDDVVHVLSLKGLFLYLSPSCKRVLEYDAGDLVGNSLSSVCHPSDIVPVTRELKDATTGTQVNIVFRIRRKRSGYTWFESHGSLFVEQGKGRKCIILVGRKRPVFALSRQNLEANGGIGDSELWTKLSTSGMFLYVSSNVRSLLDLQPESLVGTSIQDLMRKESRPEFGRAVEKARRGKIVTCKHEVQNRRGQGLQAQTVLYPGDACEGQKPSFLLAQTKLLKASSRSLAPASGASSTKSVTATPMSNTHSQTEHGAGHVSQPGGGHLAPGTQDAALASEDNIFDELRTTKCSSWQFELRQMEKVNRILAEELGGLLSNKKKRKRRKGVGNIVRDCANCHTRNTPEWRRGPSGQRDLCNSCGLRWAKQTGRVSPRNSSRGGNNGNGDSQSKKSASPIHSSPLHREVSSETPNPHAGTANNNATGATDRNASIDPTQLTSKGSATAMSGAPSATGQNPTAAMPPPSQPSLSGGAPGSSMTSIQEERETSQS